MSAIKFGRAALIAAVIVAAYGFSRQSFPFLKRIAADSEVFLVNLRYKWHPRSSSVDRLVLVTLDDEAFKRMALRWPLDRRVVADLIDRLRLAELRMIGIDLLFMGNAEPVGDQLLAGAIRKAGNVILASFEPQGGAMTGLQPEIAEAALAVGATNKIPDESMRIRKARMATGSNRPSFEAQVLKALGEAKPLPLDAQGCLEIDFMAQLGDLDVVPMDQVLQSEKLLKQLQGKIVLVGATGEVFHDILLTPLGPQPGVVVVANTLLTLLDESWIRRLPLPAAYSLWFLLGMLGLAAADQASAARSFAAAVAGFLVIVAGSVAAVLSGWLADMAGALFVFGLCWTLQLVVRFAGIAVESERLKRMATTDSLTGIPNLSYLQARLLHEAARSKRYREPLAVLMFDLDGFKQVNDRHGHACGSELLQLLVKRIAKELRQADCLARYGGDEFCAVLPHTDRAMAEALAERLRACVAAEPFQTGSGPLSLTLSVGLRSVAIGEEFLADDLLKHADTALYRSKRAGKNRVTVYGTDEKALP